LLDHLVENQIQGKVHRERSTAAGGQRLGDLGEPGRFRENSGGVVQWLLIP
jgi:hypothetical protein